MIFPGPPDGKSVMPKGWTREVFDFLKTIFPDLREVEWSPEPHYCNNDRVIAIFAYPEPATEEKKQIWFEAYPVRCRETCPPGSSSRSTTTSPDGSNFEMEVDPQASSGHAQSEDDEDFRPSRFRRYEQSRSESPTVEALANRQQRLTASGPSQPILRPRRPRTTNSGSRPTLEVDIPSATALVGQEGPPTSRSVSSLDIENLLRPRSPIAFDDFEANRFSDLTANAPFLSSPSPPPAPVSNALTNLQRSIQLHQGTLEEDGHVIDAVSLNGNTVELAATTLLNHIKKAKQSFETELEGSTDFHVGRTTNKFTLADLIKPFWSVKAYVFMFVANQVIFV